MRCRRSSRLSRRSRQRSTVRAIAARSPWFRPERADREPRSRRWRDTHCCGMNPHGSYYMASVTICQSHLAYSPMRYGSGQGLRNMRNPGLMSAASLMGLAMIDLHYWTTPNGHKITIFLEETGLPYKIFLVNIGKGEQFKREFLAVSPNNRIPAIVDHDPPGGGAPITMFESGAILVYLADKTKRFIAQDLRGRVETLEWLFWQMANLGPMSGQNNHFSNYAVEK